MYIGRFTVKVFWRCTEEGRQCGTVGRGGISLFRSCPDCSLAVCNWEISQFLPLPPFLSPFFPPSPSPTSPSLFLSLPPPSNGNGEYQCLWKAIVLTWKDDLAHRSLVLFLIWSLLALPPVYALTENRNRPLSGALQLMRTIHTQHIMMNLRSVLKETQVQGVWLSIRDH